MQQLESPNFKVILDVKAMCSMGKPIPEIIRESAGEPGYFHANDENLKGPGFGDVDFKPIGAALKEVNYDGVVSVEVFKFDEGPEMADGELALSSGDVCVGTAGSVFGSGADSSLPCQTTQECLAKPS